MRRLIDSMYDPIVTETISHFYSYNRYIQSKDLSSKSAEDMACIFGQRSKSAPGTPRVQSEVSLYVHATVPGLTEFSVN